MGKPVVRRTFKLDFLGEEWKDCYIRYTRITMSEILEFSKQEAKVEDDSDAKKVFDLASTLMAKHFIDGTGYMGEDADGKPMIEPLTVENVIDDLFVDIYIPFIKALRGGEDTNL